MSDQNCISRRKFVKLLGIGTAGILSTGEFLSSCSMTKSSKPNIVYILADDLGYGDVSFLNPGSKIKTPNIDRLAKSGMTFTDAHSGSAVCSPTRYGILTGRYAWRTRLQRSVLWPWDPPLIDEGRMTVPAFLKSSGYHTACIGKWHLGWDWYDPSGQKVTGKAADQGKNVDFTHYIENGPTARGFDYYFGSDVPNFAPYCFIENDQTVGVPSIEKPKEMFGHPGPMVENWDLRKELPALGLKAVSYINDRSQKKNPFFLYFALTAPHTPIAPDENFQGRSQAGAYGDFVMEVDTIVGNILDTLETKGLSEKTLLIFTSDNGSPGRDGTNMSGPVNSVRKYRHNPSYIYRGIKADAWEGGHHVPFFASWPGVVKKGSESSETICLTDLFATVADLVDKNLPDEAAVDSYSILPVLRDLQFNTPLREATVHHSGNGAFAIRQGKWKLILCAGSGGWSQPIGNNATPEEPNVQLYNIVEDPEEKINLQAQHQDVVQQLISLLKRYVRNGRSTPGIRQNNDVTPDIWLYD